MIAAADSLSSAAAAFKCARRPKTSSFFCPPASEQSEIHLLDPHSSSLLRPCRAKGGERRCTAERHDKGSDCVGAFGIPLICFPEESRSFLSGPTTRHEAAVSSQPARVTCRCDLPGNPDRWCRFCVLPEPTVGRANRTCFCDLNQNRKNHDSTFPCSSRSASG